MTISFISKWRNKRILQLRIEHLEEESSFVSETMRASILFFTILINISNLLLIELIFMCPISTLLASFRRVFFKNGKGSTSQSSFSKLSGDVFVFYCCCSCFLLFLHIVVFYCVNLFRIKIVFGYPTCFQSFRIATI